MLYINLYMLIYLIILVFIFSLKMETNDEQIRGNTAAFQWPLHNY